MFQMFPVGDHHRIGSHVAVRFDPQQTVAFIDEMLTPRRIHVVAFRPWNMSLYPHGGISIKGRLQTWVGIGEIVP